MRYKGVLLILLFLLTPIVFAADIEVVSVKLYNGLNRVKIDSDNVFDAIPKQSLEWQVKIKNSNAATEVSDMNIEFIVDDFDIDKDLTPFAIGRDSDSTKTLSFNIPSLIKSDDYPATLKISGSWSNGSVNNITDFEWVYNYTIQIDQESEVPISAVLDNISTCQAKIQADLATVTSKVTTDLATAQTAKTTCETEKKAVEDAKTTCLTERDKAKSNADSLQNNINSLQQQMSSYQNTSVTYQNNWQKAESDKPMYLIAGAVIMFGISWLMNRNKKKKESVPNVVADVMPAETGAKRWTNRFPGER